ncbi:hypothetical protein D9756_004440 [Leucocoprinus leucothites]|uniref:Uncharacterized protein n=1 Tax=Leucocoprinus leucothites TaxID=201217 RepID=A0A8H5LKM6_9AGAR|nr:hypothetical protein D9756_004440 [Leucoagaricus leucothites]
MSQIVTPTQSGIRPVSNRDHDHGPDTLPFRLWLEDEPHYLSCPSVYCKTPADTGPDGTRRTQYGDWMKGNLLCCRPSVHLSLPSKNHPQTFPFPVLSALLDPPFATSPHHLSHLPPKLLPSSAEFITESRLARSIL